MPNRPTDLPRFDLLGDRIVYWRERRGMTRSQLARLAKVPYSTLAEIESNKQKSTTKITQLAGALRVNAHYLATGKGNPEDLTSGPAESDSSDWPFPIDRSELMDLDEVELELVGLKLQKIVDEIRAKRPRQRARKVS
ncbi:MAG: helix-turn-helix transcriptional regulator [Microbispora sp.]|nr:helix-turn-helix transcriptional regulator [Microbispora sp.]